jgi:hypothetical protein
LRSALATLCALALAACLQPYEARHEGQWNSRDQIWMSEESQVRLRAAQSRLFDTTDRTRILAAIVATMQDEGFMIGALDEELGIVSGKRFDELESEGLVGDPAYHLYDPESLIAFSRTTLSWGPFHQRDNAVRLTVTVRRRNESQSVVRANAQFYLHAVEDPEPYQRFFVALERSLALESHLFEDAPAAGGDGGSGQAQPLSGSICVD